MPIARDFEVDYNDEGGVVRQWSSCHALQLSKENDDDDDKFARALLIDIR